MLTIPHSDFLHFPVVLLLLLLLVSSTNITWYSICCFCSPLSLSIFLIYFCINLFQVFSIVFCLFVHGSFWFRYVILLYVVCKFIILNSILARPLLCFRVYILFIWIYGTLCSNRLLMILSDWPEAVLIWIPHDQQVGILGLRVVELGFNELSTVNNAGVSSKINQINNKAKRK